MASSRPTAVPDRLLDDGARLDLALRRSAIFELPVDLMVPVRLDEATPNQLELPSAFLLAHVDNQSSIGKIAFYAGLSVHETYSRFLELLSAGIIVFGVISESTPPPSSCIISRGGAMPDDEDDSP